ncbi:MAG: GNAT family N-acetyltransferase [Geodermatophilaceae bacterium]|nr:GNAT family N-acetyltransferase [Geodermatophilaceae bacterium]
MSAAGELPESGSSYDYPLEWEADVVAADGGTVHIRPITPADADGLLGLHARSSERTRYLRFFGPYPRVSDRDLFRFTNVDHHDRVAMIALLGEELIAVGRYERLVDRDEAEVAFLVEDAHQGRGLGSVLLEHLAAAAQERGVRRFVAEVLAENRRMISIFRTAGYQPSRSYDEGVVHLVFDIAPTETLRAVRYEREQRAESRSILRLLTPRSVAVIGASNDPAKIGHAVLANLLAGGFRGTVYPVNTQADTVQGLPAYPNVLDVPDDVDLAVLTVPAEAVPQVVVHCRARGVRGIVVMSGGFAERGEEGLLAQRRLVTTARGSGMRIVGPNCFGIISTDPEFRLNASLAPAAPSAGRIGFFSQSGALGATLLERARSLGIGLSSFVSAGNRADVSGNDLLQFWATDPATEVIALHLESFGNPRKFARLARRVARTKPVVVVKSGRHTGTTPNLEGTSSALAESSVQALFASTGIVRVDTVAQLFDVVTLLAHQPLPRGPRVAVVGNSTAVGLLAVDSLLGNGLKLAGSAPVDIGADGTPEQFAAATRTALTDPEVDALIAVFVTPVSRSDSSYARALVDLTRSADKPIVATFLGRDGLPASLVRDGGDEVALRGSVPSFPVDRAVAALAQTVRYSHWRSRPVGDFPELRDTDSERARTLVGSVLAAAPGGRELSGPETEELLACYAVPVSAADTDPESDSVATTVEISDDPSFGAVVCFGVSGVPIELFADRAYRALPLSDLDAAELIRSVAAWPLLDGYGSAVPVDAAAIEDVLVRAARLCDDVPEVARLQFTLRAHPHRAEVEGPQVHLRPASARAEEAPRRADRSARVD